MINRWKKMEEMDRDVISAIAACLVVVAILVLSSVFANNVSAGSDPVVLYKNLSISIGDVGYSLDKAKLQIGYPKDTIRIQDEVKNRSTIPITFSISVRESSSVAEGYVPYSNNSDLLVVPLYSRVTVQPGKSGSFEVLLANKNMKSRINTPTEIWISLLGETNSQVQGELVLRILVGK